MSNTCEPVGGFRLIGADGPTEFIPFPEEAEQDSWLESFDPQNRQAALQAIEEGKVYDIRFVGASTEEGEEYEVQILDGRDVYVLVSVEDPSFRSGNSSLREKFCLGGMVAGLGLAAGSLVLGLFSNRITLGPKSAIATYGGWGLFALSALVVCRAGPPPSPPGGGMSTSEPREFTRGKVVSISSRSFLEPVAGAALLYLTYKAIRAVAAGIVFTPAAGVASLALP